MKLILLLAFCANLHAAVLEWDANPPIEYNGITNVFGDEYCCVVTNVLLGYKVHWGAESGYYSSVFDVGNVTSLEVPDAFGRVYYAVTAYDTELRESAYSDEIFYDWPTPSAVPSRPMNLRFTGTNGVAQIRLQQRDSLANGIAWRDSGIAFVPVTNEMAFFRAEAPGTAQLQQPTALRYDGSKRGKL